MFGTAGYHLKGFIGLRMAMDEIMAVADSFRMLPLYEYVAIFNPFPL
jgi:hypothetical protein